MNSPTARLLEGGTTTLSSAEIESLRSKIIGSLVLPHDATYDESRRLWNGMFDHHPALIVLCECAADVVEAVRFCRDHDLLVAVRGGAHNVAGLAGADQAVTIDLSRMRTIHVDPLLRRVRVEAGALLGDVDRATQAFQLVVPTGVVSETGIAGLTLNGGLGWLRRKWGMTCDNLIAADLVCADGALHRVSGTEDAELLWALRGGGGNFGIVTAFEFQAHPLGPDVMFCFVVYPDDPELMARYAAFIATEPEEIGTLAFTGTVPAADTFPRDSWGSPFFVVAACYAGPVAEGHRSLQPLRELGSAIVDLSAAIPFVEVQKFLDEEYPKGRNYYWKSLYLREFTPQVIDILRNLTHRAPSPLSTIDIWTMGGALARVSSDDSPLAPRRAPFMIGIEANWERPEDNEANIEWVKDCLEALTPHAADGIYLNFPGFLENSEALVRSAYGGNHARLVRIKQQYDPDNFFRLNQNIKPCRA